MSNNDNFLPSSVCLSHASHLHSNTYSLVDITVDTGENCSQDNFHLLKLNINGRRIQNLCVDAAQTCGFRARARSNTWVKSHALRTFDFRRSVYNRYIVCGWSPITVKRQVGRSCIAPKSFIAFKILRNNQSVMVVC